MVVVLCVVERSTCLAVESVINAGCLEMMAVREDS